MCGGGELGWMYGESVRGVCQKIRVCIASARDVLVKFECVCIWRKIERCVIKISV